jgi:nitrile hydratase accessory protein
LSTHNAGPNDCPTLPDFSGVPGLPRDEEGVVFAAPWEAKAFALVVHLHQRGAFAWQDWVSALSSEIAADRARPVETPYYELWLSAAEKLMTQQGLVENGSLGALRDALRSAQSDTAHGHHHDHGDDHDHAHGHDHHHPH